MAEYFPVRTIARAGSVDAFVAGGEGVAGLVYSFEGERHTVDDFFERNHSSGMVVLDAGQLSYEKYRAGTGPTTRFTSFSVAKSITATLVGLAIADRAIQSVDDLLTRYIGELEGSAYAGVTIKQALQMSSGVRFSEDYTDLKSDIYAFTGLSMVQNKVPANQMIKRLERAAPPGTVFNYSTGETQVLAWLVREATGKAPAHYLSEKIWSILGMEHDASWILDRSGGMEMGGIGINATVRDYARFGQLMANDGVWNGRRILHAGWVEEATTPDAPHLAHGKLVRTPLEGYQYQWWSLPGEDGAYAAQGVFGQLLYVNPTRNVVIAKTSSWPRGTDSRLKGEAYAAFDAIAKHLASQRVERAAAEEPK
jgi:CubicO group peptidase (beta-lactamase class C family)